MKRAIAVLITDLDNTLYDWVHIWYSSFKPMFDRIAEISGIPEETLKADFKGVHQRHGTSEYSFAIQELPCLQARHQESNLIQIYSSAIDAYRERRREALKLYPSVENTLTQFQEAGTLIVAYTESMAFYSRYRIRKTGLDSLIDYLYCPEDHDMPKGLTPEQIRLYPSEQYELQKTRQRYTPRGVNKPSSQVLNTILSDLEVAPFEAAYVGDDLRKDMLMAKETVSRFSGNWTIADFPKRLASVVVTA